MANDSYGFLLAQPDPATEPWWDALRRHELTIQSCARCQTVCHPPRPVCAECGSEEREWRVMAGTGTVYSYIVVHRAPLPQWKAEVPYNVALISLDDAPHIRLHGNVVDVSGRSLHVGMRVSAVFDDVTAEDTMLRWKPA